MSAVMFPNCFLLPVSPSWRRNHRTAWERRFLKSQPRHYRIAWCVREGLTKLSKKLIPLGWPACKHNRYNHVSLRRQQKAVWCFAFLFSNCILPLSFSRSQAEAVSQRMLEWILRRWADTSSTSLWRSSAAYLHGTLEMTSNPLNLSVFCFNYMRYTVEWKKCMMMYDF